ncbi:MAG: L-histidine N(alpha)-methyltransferase [Woeseia sp.]|nr:L-histidine N(alpha)-methyltransferase [Woeseia sp.]
MVKQANDVRLTEQAETTENDFAEIVAGLSGAQKFLSPKFFYDDTGSQLFEMITETPEYYPTQTELGIMQDHGDDIAELIGPQASLIEFGSGSSLKTRLLLDQMIEPAVYVPVDISRELLVASAKSLNADFPDLEVLPVVADFTQAFDLPSPRVMPLRNVVYFPGSTIGNFEPEDAKSLLDVMYQEAGEDGALLIGVDLQKEKSVLEAAYNDSLGVTASFNLNLLRRLNREFGANFDVESFEHYAFYNEAMGRIEMHLRSKKAQNVRVGRETFSFRAGETIHTENSHKFTKEGFRALAARADFEVREVWTDDRDYFSVQYCTRS